MTKAEEPAFLEFAIAGTSKCFIKSSCKKTRKKSTRPILIIIIIIIGSRQGGGRQAGSGDRVLQIGRYVRLQTNWKDKRVTRFRRVFPPLIFSRKVAWSHEQSGPFCSSSGSIEGSKLRHQLNASRDLPSM